MILLIYSSHIHLFLLCHSCLLWIRIIMVYLEKNWEKLESFLYLGKNWNLKVVLYPGMGGSTLFATVSVYQFHPCVQNLWLKRWWDGFEFDCVAKIIFSYCSFQFLSWFITEEGRIMCNIEIQKLFMVEFCYRHWRLFMPLVVDGGIIVSSSHWFEYCVKKFVLDHRYGKDLFLSLSYLGYAFLDVILLFDLVLGYLYWPLAPSLPPPSSILIFAFCVMLRSFKFMSG